MTRSDITRPVVMSSDRKWQIAPFLRSAHIQYIS